jgi:hypothetical protein
MEKRCADCRDGEHENYDDYVRFVVVRDPDSKRGFFKRAYMCSQHRYMYESDGYKVDIIVRT